MSERIRTASWAGVDDPDRLDAATVHLGDRRLRATGVQRAAGYAAAWRLETGPEWVTERLEVVVLGADLDRLLLLERSADGAWTVRVDLGPTDAQPPPAEADPLDGADDCDLGLCPMTNTMPILRSGLPAARRSRPFVMALVEMPGLHVVRSEQVYGPAGEAAVRFSSGDFTAELGVDPDGLVRGYPGLARRL